MTEAEFLPLFDRYRSMVYGLALSYTRSPQDAEDVCQSVFLKLMEAPPAPGKEKAWLAQVTVNHCRNLLTACEAGYVIIPPMLTFYSDYPTAQDQVDHIIGKILLQFDLDYDRFQPWKG